jgi:hypothetical protein
MDAASLAPRLRGALVGHQVDVLQEGGKWQTVTIVSYDPAQGLHRVETRDGRGAAVKLTTNNTRYPAGSVPVSQAAGDGLGTGGGNGSGSGGRAGGAGSAGGGVGGDAGGRPNKPFISVLASLASSISLENAAAAAAAAATASAAASGFATKSRGASEGGGGGGGGGGGSAGDGSDIGSGGGGGGDGGDGGGSGLWGAGRGTPTPSSVPSRAAFPRPPRSGLNLSGSWAPSASGLSGQPGLRIRLKRVQLSSPASLVPLAAPSSVASTQGAPDVDLRHSESSGGRASGSLIRALATVATTVPVDASMGPDGGTLVTLPAGHAPPDAATAPPSAHVAPQPLGIPAVVPMAPASPQAASASPCQRPGSGTALDAHVAAPSPVTGRPSGHKSLSPSAGSGCLKSPVLPPTAPPVLPSDGSLAASAGPRLLSSGGTAAQPAGKGCGLRGYFLVQATAPCAMSAPLCYLGNPRSLF